jgi:hypothetical protein
VCDTIIGEEFSKFKEAKIEKIADVILQTPSLWENFSTETKASLSELQRAFRVWVIQQISDDVEPRNKMQVWQHFTAWYRKQVREGREIKPIAVSAPKQTQPESIPLWKQL